MEKRATSDLLSNSSYLKHVLKIECLTIETEETKEHSLNVVRGTIITDEPNVADAAISAIITMIHHF